MFRSKPVNALIVLALVAGAILPGRLAAQETNVPAPVPAPADSQALSFSDHIMPFFSANCVACHGHERKKADLNLQAYEKAPAFFEERKTWEKIIDMLASREMPPENKPQPTEEERQRVIRFIRGELEKLDCTGPINPGRVTIRRLNRSEYNNTIRDLIGVDFQPAADFPNDEVGYGFDNIGDVLSLPPMLMEKYLAAAEAIATQAIVPNAYQPPRQRIEAETLPSTANGGSFEDRALSLDTEGEAYIDFEFPKHGEYIIRARAFGMQAGPDPARMAFRVGGEDLRIADVTAVEAKPEIYEVRSSIEAGKRRLAVAYLNNYNVPDHPDPKLRGDRNLVVDYIEVEGPFGAAIDLPETHSRIIPRRPPPGREKEFAAEILKRFAQRAYRRPVTQEEVKRLVRFVDLAKEEGGTFEEGVQLAVQAVLVSPYFLFRWELDRGATPPGEFRNLSDYELASRLSYFIWSSMPDDQLFELAGQGVLSRPDVLETQVKRMLRDPRSYGGLVQNFGNQWLTIRNLETVTPDADLFPDFDDDLRLAMQRETELFFDAIMREDRSILEFLDADFTFLNGRLARHYGIDGVEGSEFQRVSLDKSSLRGGILTHASILTITSNPTRTSPVSRGKWILEQIFGAPPPPPPPDAGELSEDEQSVQSASLRQRLEQHRIKPDCAVCHNKMDPLGFAFENFDAIGKWRAQDGKFPIDPSGTLPNGESFKGPGELKAILKTDEAFIRSLAEKMLTFALGRGLEYYDQCAVDEICKALKKEGYKFSTLVTELVKSKPFQMRKVEGSN